MRKDCLIVLDTLGTRSTSAIVGIHAARFDLDDSSTVMATHHHAVSVDSNRDAGRTYDGETLAWWADRAEGVDVFTREGAPLDAALRRLHEFYEGADTLWMMGRGMEAAVLNSAFEYFHMAPPWPYYNVRDGRTLCDVVAWMEGRHIDVTPRGDTSAETLELRYMALQAAYDAVKAHAAIEAAA